MDNYYPVVFEIDAVARHFLEHAESLTEKEILTELTAAVTQFYRVIETGLSWSEKDEPNVLLRVGHNSSVRHALLVTPYRRG